jgi:hypothetical protein
VAELSGPDRPLWLQDVAGVIGGLRDVEMALFCWLGRIAPTLTSAGEVAWASGASLRAAWRATQLEQLLPVSVGVAGAGGEAAPPDTPLGAAGEALGPAPAASGSSTVLRLASAWYEALLQAYSFRLERLSTAADGPLERVLQRLVADLEAEQKVVRAFGLRPGRHA